MLVHNVATLSPNFRIGKFRVSPAIFQKTAPKSLELGSFYPVCYEMILFLIGSIQSVTRSFSIGSMGLFILSRLPGRLAYRDRIFPCVHMEYFVPLAEQSRTQSNACARARMALALGKLNFSCAVIG